MKQFPVTIHHHPTNLQHCPQPPYYFPTSFTLLLHQFYPPPPQQQQQPMLYFPPSNHPLNNACNNCKRRGHFPRECPNVAVCNNCGLSGYTLCWEYNNLAALSTAVRDLIASKITGQLMSMGAMLTVMASVMTALALPTALISASDLIDSKWAIGLDRSDKAGKLLAEVLLEGHHGHRPVTLIGISLGARVVFKCLQSLAETEGDHGINVWPYVAVISLRVEGRVSCRDCGEGCASCGAPISLENENWILARKMVCGRFVNAYSTNDWTFGVAFRTNLISKGLAGIQPVDALGIENVDVTHMIEGHSSYIQMTERILENLDLDIYHPVWVNVNTEPDKPETPSS